MKICISRIDRMGDMILTLPVIKSIKIQNPNSEIHVLASEKNAKVLKNIKYIDKILLIGLNLSSFIWMLNQIQKTKYDLFINFSPTFKSYILCFFSKSHKKAALVFLSRYRKSFFTKFLLKIFTNYFCHFRYVVDRFDRLENNQELHQTKMMFNLIKKSQIKYDENVLIDIVLPSTKITFSKKKLIVLHLSEKWINPFYSEDNFLELISLLTLKKYSIVLTTDNSTKKKFSKIFDKYKVISNKEFKKLKSINSHILILDNLDYDSWTKIIYSSYAVITPECGCTHISAACKVPVNIIYDPNNHPEAIHKEYSPWKSKYNKFIFGENNLNKKLIVKI